MQRVCSYLRNPPSHFAYIDKPYRVHCCCVAQRAGTFAPSLPWQPSFPRKLLTDDAGPDMAGEHEPLHFRQVSD